MNDNPNVEKGKEIVISDGLRERILEKNREYRVYTLARHTDVDGELPREDASLILDQEQVLSSKNYDPLLEDTYAVEGWVVEGESNFIDLNFHIENHPEHILFHRSRYEY
ncbi:MAG: hypothetical protein ABIH34_06445 [Nanoarchaeota archaeon]